jgi:tetratricopeptide (TPR) repeat protein
MLHPRRYGDKEMKRFRAALLTFVCLLCVAADLPSILAQHGRVTVDWKAELAKAKAGIAKNPKSAFWHNQAGVAYDALGDFANAVKELKLASTLDPSNPADDYALYFLYKRKAMHSKQRQVLLDALEKDPNNPVGRLEFAYVLEEEKYWADSLREYQVAKRLAASVKGPVYTDPRGNPFDIDGVREEVDKAIDRVVKLNAHRQD